MTGHKDLKDPSMAIFPHADHDHQHCLETLMVAAAQLCDHQGLRLGQLRRAVLAAVAGSHKTIGAYQIIDELAASGKKVAPISVYRCLEFLQTAGLIHKLSSTNGYFICRSAFEGSKKPCGDDLLVLLVCQGCGAIGEMDGEGLSPLVRRFAAKGEFVDQHSQLEISGLCRSCRKNGPADRKSAGAQPC